VEWIRTALGSPIELVSSAPLANLRGERPIIVVGGVHGDEPEGVRLAQDTLAWLQKMGEPSETGEAGEKVTPWVVIPCLNVDGYQRQTRVNARGVDLNRNYPSDNWSPVCEKERYFPGPYPASEPEIQGLVSLFEILHPRLVIHCHSWKPCIVATGPSARPDAERLGTSSGYEVVEEIGYPTPGSLSRYGWHNHRIPIICIEEQELLTDLSTIWPRFEAGMKAIFTDHSLRGGV
jgi:hypothetical protein